MSLRGVDGAVESPAELEHDDEEEDVGDQDEMYSKELDPFTGTIRIEDMINHVLDMHVKTFGITRDVMDAEEVSRGFQTAASNIKALLEKINAETLTLNGNIVLAMNDKIRYLTDKVNGVFKDFVRLEQKASSVTDNTRSSTIYEEHLTSTYNRETLDKTRRERDKARELRMLAMYFEDFYHGKTTKIESLSKSDTLVDLLKVAEVIKKLTQASMSPVLKGFSATIQSIQIFGENFEKKMLDDFQNAYIEKNDAKLSTCSKILSALNGGRSYIDSYIQNHEFFKSELCIATPDQIISIYHSPKRECVDILAMPTLDPALEKLFREIRRTCHNTWTSIVNLFDQPHVLMSKMLQKIFLGPVQRYIDAVLVQARDHSQLAYVQTLYASYLFTKEFIIDIQNMSDSHHRRLSVYLDDLFSPYLDQKYLDSEISCMKQLIGVLLSDWNDQKLLDYLSQNLNRDDPAVELLFSMFSQHAKQWPSIPYGFLYRIDDAPLVFKEYFLSDIQLSAQSDSLKGHLNRTSKFSGFLCHIEVINRSFHILNYSMNRIRALCTKEQLPNAINSILEAFLKSIIDSFLLPKLDLLISMPVSFAKNPQDQPDPSFAKISFLVAGSTLVPLHLVSLSTRFIQSIQLYFQSQLTWLMATLPNTIHQTIDLKNSYFTRVHGKLDIIVRKELESVLDWIRFLLNRQPKEDYSGSDNDSNHRLMGTTSTCNIICQELSHLPSYVLGHLQPTNAFNFIEELGAGFFSLLLDHIRTFTMYTHGAIILNKDMTKYQEAMRLFLNERVNIYFGLGREIVKLFLIEPNNLKFLLLEGKAVQYQHHIIPTSSLHTFVECREDFKRENLETVFFVKTHYKSQLAKVFKQ